MTLLNRINGTKERLLQYLGPFRQCLTMYEVFDGPVMMFYVLRVGTCTPCLESLY